MLGADARPFDESQADAAEMPGFDGVENARIGNGRRIALALQLELRRVDAARDIRGQDQKQIDIVGGERRRGQQRAGGEHEGQQGFDHAHRRT